MKSLIIVFIILISFTSHDVQAQQWKIYNSGNTGMPIDVINTFALERDSNCTIAWIFGLVRYNFQRNKWIFYDTSSNTVPTYAIYNVVVNGHDKWICHSKGLTKFDNTTWTTYNPQNSGIASNLVLDITFDNDGAAWIACTPGLSKFFNGQWKTYNTENSPLINNRLETIESYGNEVWIGTYNSGLARIIKTPTDTLWKIYTSTNSPLTYNWTDDILIKYPLVYIGLSGGGLNKFNLIDSSWIAYFNPGFLQGLALDTSGNIWFGSPGGGLYKFTKDTTLVNFNPSNSPMPSYTANCVRVDIHQNVWVGTNNGLVIYNENGIVGIDDETLTTIAPKDFQLFQNYPNPFNPITNISYQIPKDGFVTLKVFDLLGREITTLVNEIKKPGSYEVSFNGDNLASGIYFYRLEVYYENGDKNFIDTKRMVLVK